MQTVFRTAWVGWVVAIWLRNVEFLHFRFALNKWGQSEIKSSIPLGDDAIIILLRPHLSLKKRKAGIAKGAVTDAFFEPLSDDELDVWEK